MAEKNPFDLEGRDGGPERPHVARIWTADEAAEKLSGYLEVPPEFWDQVRYGTHMRYITKDGQFRPGGFVMKNPFDTEVRGGPDKKRFFKLQNGFSDKVRGYQQWLLAYEDAAKVYMKPDASVPIMLQSLETAVRGLNENIRKVADHSKRLEQRVAALERP